MQQQRTPPVTSLLSTLKQALSPNTASIQLAQQHLLQQSKNPDFLPLLLSIPTIPQIPNDVCKLAILYTKNHVLHLLATQQNNRILASIQAILKFLSFPSSTIVFHRYKDYVKDVLVEILIKEKSKTVLLSFQQQFLVEIQNVSILDKEGTADRANFQYIAFFGLALIESIPIGFLVNHMQFLETSFSGIVSVAELVTKLLWQLIEKQNNLQKIQEKGEIAISVMSKLTDTITKYIIKLRMANIDIKTLSQVSLSPILVPILPTTSPNSNPLQSPLLLPFLTSPNFHSLLLSTLAILTQFTKSSTKAYTIASESTSQCKQCNKLINSQLFKQLPQLVQFFIQYVSNMVKMGKKTASDPFGDVVGEIIGFFGVGLRCNFLYRVFEKNSTSLLFGVLIPLLQFGPDQYRKYQEDPEQFVNMVYQITNKQQQDKQQLEQMKNKPSKLEPRSTSQPQPQPQLQPQPVSQPSPQSPPSLKCMASKFLVSYLHTIDSKLFQLGMLCLQILDSSTQQSLFKKDTIYLILIIVGRLVLKNQGLAYRLGVGFVTNLRIRRLPYQRIKQPDRDLEEEDEEFDEQEQLEQAKKDSMNDQSQTQKNIQFCMNLMAIQKYLFCIWTWSQNIVDQLFKLIQKIIQDGPEVKKISNNPNSKTKRTRKIAQVAKIVVANLSKKILKLPEGTLYAADICSLVQRGLDNESSTNRMLDCLLFLVTQNAHQLSSDLREFTGTCQKVFNLLGKFVQHSTKSTSQNNTILHKLWLILEEVSVNQFFMPFLHNFMHESLKQLWRNITGIYKQNKCDFSLYKKSEKIELLQQKIYSILCNLLKQAGKIQQLQLQIIQLCIYKFHNNTTPPAPTSSSLWPSQQKYSLSLYYPLLQHILFYIPAQLPPQLQQKLVEVSLISLSARQIDTIPRSQSEQCEGLLLLQTMILSVSKGWSKEVWQIVARKLRDRIGGWQSGDDGSLGRMQGVSYDFFQAELKTTLLLAFAYGGVTHGLEIFEGLSQTLDNVINIGYCFTYPNTAKLFSISLIELLPFHSLTPIRQKTPQIVKTLVSLFQLVQSKKDKILQHQQPNSEQSHYLTLKSQTLNLIIELDQLELFQQELGRIRDGDRQFYYYLLNCLPEGKYRGLGRLVNSRKIGENVRYIYRIKGTGQSEGKREGNSGNKAGHDQKHNQNGNHTEQYKHEPQRQMGEMEQMEQME